ncbi:L10-interacting MYB domain-containing protein [Rosa sericea]
MFGSSTPKATWSPAHRKIFFDLCLDEVSKGNRPGTHFTKDGWKNIVDSFYEETGVKYTKKQMKNHWDFTKKQWKVWIKLVAESNMKWDPSTSKFGASAKDWANYIQVYPEAAQFQYKELPFPDKLEIIFAGVIDSEGMEISYSRKRQNDSSDSSFMQSEEQELANMEGEDEHLFDTEDEHLFAAEDEHGFHAIPRKSAEKVQSHLRSRRAIASEPSLSSSSQTKAKAVWTPAYHRAFLDLCVEETLKGNKPRTHFTRDAWRTILESFQQRTGLGYNRLQLKNHWDITKEQWRVWSKLIGTSSSMGWDPNTKKFGATEEVWANYLESNPEAAPFRYKEPQFTDKLEIIFDGTTVTGETEPPTKRSKYNDNSSASVLNIDEPAMRNQAGNIEHFDAVPISFRQAKLTYSIGECIDCLDAMEEVVQGSDLYLFALDVFLKKEYREIFLQLKKPNVRIAWLQRLQSVGPPLV